MVSEEEVKKAVEALKSSSPEVLREAVKEIPEMEEELRAVGKRTTQTLPKIRKVSNRPSSWTPRREISGESLFFICVKLNYSHFQQRGRRHCL
jgi:hypothetical protein